MEKTNHRISTVLHLDGKMVDFFRGLNLEKKGEFTYKRKTFGVSVVCYTAEMFKVGDRVEMNTYTHFHAQSKITEVRVVIKPSEKQLFFNPDFFAKFFQDARKGKICNEWKNKIRNTFYPVVMEEETTAPKNKKR